MHYECTWLIREKINKQYFIEMWCVTRGLIHMNALLISTVNYKVTFNLFTVTVHLLYIVVSNISPLFLR